MSGYLFLLCETGLSIFLVPIFCIYLLVSKKVKKQYIWLTVFFSVAYISIHIIFTYSEFEDAMFDTRYHNVDLVKSWLWLLSFICMQHIPVVVSYMKKKLIKTIKADIFLNIALALLMLAVMVPINCIDAFGDTRPLELIFYIPYRHGFSAIIFILIFTSFRWTADKSNGNKDGDPLSNVADEENKE